MKWLALAAILIVAVIATVLGPRAARTEGALPDALQGEIEQRRASADPGRNRANAAAERTSVTLGGRVVDAGGTPLGGALVTFDPLPAMVRKEAFSWGVVEMDWEGLLKSRQQCVSDEAGAFPLPERGEDLAVWVTHPGYVAAQALLPADGTELEVHLEAADSAPVVRVVDQDNRPVDGAQVEQFLTLVRCDPDLPNAGIRVLRTYYRVASTDREGECVVPWHKELAVRARKGRLMSPTQMASSDVTILRMSEAAFVQGEVLPAPGSGDVLPASVSFRGTDEEGDPVYLWGCNISRYGPFGPVEIPSGRGPEMKASVDGDECVHVEKAVPMPAAGQTAYVRFELEEGQELRIRVVDSAGTPLAGAGALCLWDSGKSTTTESARTWTTRDGTATVRGLPSGEVDLDAWADGFSPVRLAAVELPRAEELEVVLPPPARVAGKVTRDGVPVEDFVILYWEGKPGITYGMDVHGAKQGEFIVDDVVPGPVGLCAAGDGIPPSEIVIVDVPPNGTTTVNLQIPLGHSATGTVVDAVTREPIPGAEILVLPCDGRRFHGVTGTSGKTDQGGEFRLDGFGEDFLGIGILADGYSDYWDIRAADPGKREVDLGTIPLHRRRDITVHVTGVSPEELDGLVTWTTVADESERVPFSADGVAVIPGVRKGDHRVWIKFADGRKRSQFHEFTPEDDEWLVEFRLKEGSQVRARLIGSGLEGADSMVAEYAVDGTYSSRSRVPVMRDEEGALAVFEGVPSFGEVILQAYDGEDLLGTWDLTMNGEAAREERLSLSGRHVWLRVVDGQGHPLPGAIVSFTRPHSTGFWRTETHTDEQGEVRLASVAGVDELVASLRSPQVGQAWGVRVPVVDDAVTEPQVVVLEASARLEVTCRDGDQPAGNVMVRLTQPDTWYGIIQNLTDGQGRITWDGYNPGRYRVQLMGDEYWPASRTLDLTPGANQVTLPLYRRRDLRFIVRDANGARVEGARLELEHVQLGQSVASWLDQGLVGVQPAGGATDANGELVFTGVPPGTYEWACQGASGRFELPAGGDETVRIQL